MARTKRFIRGRKREFRMFLAGRATEILKKCSAFVYAGFMAQIYRRGISEREI